MAAKISAPELKRRKSILAPVAFSKSPLAIPTEEGRASVWYPTTTVLSAACAAPAMSASAPSAPAKNVLRTIIAFHLHWAARRPREFLAESGGEALDGPGAKDGRVVHHAGLVEVVERCVVSAEAVVPKGHVAKLPAPTDRELGLGEMREEEGEQRVALRLFQFEDARGETGVDEQPSPAVLDRANDRVHNRRIG